jgi:hypothetical protein
VNGHSQDRRACLKRANNDRSGKPTKAPRYFGRRVLKKAPQKRGAYS